MSGQSAAWCVPFPSKGSGGFRSIIQNAQALRKAGFSCDLYVAPSPDNVFDPVSMRENLMEWYGFKAEGLFFADNLTKPYDVVIATSWDTVSFVSDVECDCKLYFVQDFEPWFMPMGDLRIAAEQTYRRGIPEVTIGRWLSARLSALGSKPIAYCDFGANGDVYHPIEGAVREHAICALCQPEKPRRMTNLLLNSIRVLVQSDPSLKVYLYGSDQLELPLYPQVNNLGVLSIEECNELYNKCACGIVLSASNPSRIPFEMMAAGLPVVDLFRENNLYDYAEGDILLAEQTPEGISSAVLQLLNNRALAESLSRRGIALMSGRSIDAESSAFVRAVKSLLASGDKEAEAKVPMRTYAGQAFTVDAACRSLACEQERLVRHQSFVQQNPVSASSFSVEVTIENEGSAEASYKLAIWSGYHQEDLIWVPLAKKSVGVLRSKRIEFKRAVDDHPVRYCMHLYKDEPGNESQFQAGFTFRVKHGKDSVFHLKRQHIVLREATVQFDVTLIQ